MRTLAAGVCHSDIHIWEGEYDLGGGKKLIVRDRGLTPPLTMGHEIVGEVVALGPEAEGVKIGDRRLVHPWIGCGDCVVCRKGDEQLCVEPALPRRAQARRLRATTCWCRTRATSSTSAT